MINSTLSQTVTDNEEIELKNGSENLEKESNPVARVLRAIYDDEPINYIMYNDQVPTSTASGPTSTPTSSSKTPKTPNSQKWGHTKGIGILETSH